MKFFAKTIDFNSKKNIPHPLQNVFGYCLIGFLFFLLIGMFNEYFWNINWIDFTSRGLAAVFLILTLYYRISLKFKKKIVHGKNSGYIMITNDHIEMDDRIYSITKIKNLKIITGDYTGKFIDLSFHTYAPGKSSGVDNSIYFEYEAEKIHKLFFIKNEEQLEIINKLIPKLKDTVANNVYNS